MRLRVGISACLLGEQVRYDGGHKREPGLVEALGGVVEWVPVCPEVELGLGVPREPIRLEGDPRAPRLVSVAHRRDHTSEMARLADERVDALAADIAGYVFKKDSPSCGMARVPVYDAHEVAIRDGVGAFARVLIARLPRLPVAEEEELRDPAQRERFVERVRAYARSNR